MVEHRPSQDCIILGVHVCIRNNGHEMSNEGQSEASKFDRCTKYRYIPGNTSSVGVPLGILVLARIKEKK